MRPLRVVAIDDEALAIRRVQIALASLPNIELVGTAHGGLEGLQMVRDLAPDVALVDISMPEFGGFEVVESLNREDPPMVIFVTAFDEHAIRAFEVNAIDYLLKPLNFARLSEALEKARKSIEQKDAETRAAELQGILDAVRASRQASSEARFETDIWVPKGGGFERIGVSDIEYVEAERDYVRLHTANGSWLLRETMAGMQARLDPRVFTRVHRSALVRTERIAAVSRSRNGKFKIQITTGAELSVGSTYVPQIRKLLNRRADP